MDQETGRETYRERQGETGRETERDVQKESGSDREWLGETVKGQ